MDDDVRRSLAAVQASTERVLASAGALPDARARAASALPGWTRGHVLTHIARNADGLGNLLRWARTGVRTPMYPSEADRDAGIEAGAGRGAADLAADVRQSAASFAEQAASLPADAWTVPVERRGSIFPASGVLPRRLSELEIHHVDLALGYGPGDWPAEFVAASLPEVAGSFAGRDDVPACLLGPDAMGKWFRIGPDQPVVPRIVVTGPSADLLGWLLGRSAGAALRVVRASTPPVLPPWR